MKHSGGLSFLCLGFTAWAGKRSDCVSPKPERRGSLRRINWFHGGVRVLGASYETSLSWRAKTKLMTHEFEAYSCPSCRCHLPKAWLSVPDGVSASRQREQTCLPPTQACKTWNIKHCGHTVCHRVLSEDVWRPPEERGHQDWLLVFVVSQFRCIRDFWILTWIIAVKTQNVNGESV